MFEDCCGAQFYSIKYSIGSFQVFVKADAAFLSWWCLDARHILQTQHIKSVRYCARLILTLKAFPQICFRFHKHGFLDQLK